MKRLHLALLPCLLVVVLAGLFLRPTFAHGATTSPANCGKGWSVVSSPNKERGLDSGNALSGVAAISTTDVWAVGNYIVPGPHGGSIHILAEHWNGTAWSIVPVASPEYGYFFGVAAVATNDVWAVGVNLGVGTGQTLIEHWNGTTWSVIASPHPTNSSLDSVSAISSTDIWAVGTADSGTLIMHWNGTAWSVIPGISVPEAYLNAVTAISATDVWAVGSTFDRSVDPALIEHWDGKNWQVVASPTIAGSGLSGIAAVSPQMIWAVGSITPNYKQTQTLIERWNGTKWTVIPSPNPGGLQSQLTAVSAVSENNVWAVGYGNSAFIVHWNGTAWSAVSSPHVPNSELGRLTVIPGTAQLWVVGNYLNNNYTTEKTLTEFYC